MQRAGCSAYIKNFKVLEGLQNDTSSLKVPSIHLKIKPVEVPPSRLFTVSLLTFTKETARAEHEGVWVGFASEVGKKIERL